VTGDGRDDLVVMSGQTYAVPNLSVLAQQAEGAFGTAAEYRVDTNVNTNGIGIGDFSGDGLPDVAASFGGNRPSSNIAFFNHNASGTLDDPITNKGTLAVTATVAGAADDPNGANDTDSVSVVVR
jgi:hypothetical protein